VAHHPEAEPAGRAGDPAGLTASTMPQSGSRRPRELLEAGALALGVRLDPTALDRFTRYLEELERWSASINLTALRRPADIVRDGFLDSLACDPLVPPETRRAIDIGSGAGFPAIPLAIARPALPFTLVEATRKKVTFLRHVARTLGLDRVQALHERAERLAREPAQAGAYDLALARAAAPLLEQAALVRPFLAAGGLFLAQVSALPGGEAVRALRSLGLAVERTVRVPRDSGATRHILGLRAG